MEIIPAGIRTFWLEMMRTLGGTFHFNLPNDRLSMVQFMLVGKQVKRSIYTKMESIAEQFGCGVFVNCTKKITSHFATLNATLCVFHQFRFMSEWAKLDRFGVFVCVIRVYAHWTQYNFIFGCGNRYTCRSPWIADRQATWLHYQIHWFINNVSQWNKINDFSLEHQFYRRLFLTGWWNGKHFQMQWLETLRFFSLMLNFYWPLKYLDTTKWLIY